MLTIWYLSVSFFALFGFLSFLGLTAVFVADVFLPRLRNRRRAREFQRDTDELARRHREAMKYGLVPFYPLKDRIIRQDAIDAARITGQFETRRDSDKQVLR